MGDERFQLCLGELLAIKERLTVLKVTEVKQGGVVAASGHLTVDTGDR